MKKSIYYSLITIMVLLDIVYIINSIQNVTYVRMATYLVLIPILLFPFILEKILKKKLTEELKLIYYIFIFLAQFLGSVVNLYKTVSWFDTFTHYTSGIISSLLAIMIYSQYNKSNKNKIFRISYIIGFTFLIAGLWEMFEFGMDTFVGTNLQHNLETGVKDTMIDIVSAFLGTITYLVCDIKNETRIKLYQ